MSGMDDDALEPGYRPATPPRGRGLRAVPSTPAWEDDYARDRRARDPRRSHPILTLFLVSLAILCIAFAAAPLFAFRAVRSAAQFGDVQALSGLVDYEAVRQSLRVQLRPASAERAPPRSILRDPLGAIRRAWEPATLQADVDPYLSAEALASLAMGRGRDAPASETQPTGVFGGPFPAIRYWDFHRARLGVTGPAGQETIFTFERRSGLFTWKLVGVRLPA